MGINRKNRGVGGKSWNPVERKIQEEAFFNVPGREWLKRQVEVIGRGKFLLNKLTVMTPLVKQRAFELSYGRDALGATNRILDYVSCVPFIQVSPVTAARFYGRQTADDIISGKPIPTFRGNFQGYLGCQIFVGTTISLLRAANQYFLKSNPSAGRITDIMAVRTISPRAQTKEGKILGMPHTIVSLKINGVPYLADPFKKGYSFIGSNYIGKRGKTLIPLSFVEDKVNQLKKQGSWKEARDPADHKIRTFEDYAREAEKAGGEIASKADLDRLMDEIRRGK